MIKISFVFTCAQRWLHFDFFTNPTPFASFPFLQTKGFPGWRPGVGDLIAGPANRVLMPHETSLINGNNNHDQTSRSRRVRWRWRKQDASGDRREADAVGSIHPRAPKICEGIFQFPLFVQQSLQYGIVFKRLFFKFLLSNFLILSIIFLQLQILRT